MTQFTDKLERIQSAHWADEGQHTPEYAVCEACSQQILTAISEVIGPDVSPKVLGGRAGGTKPFGYSQPIIAQNKLRASLRQAFGISPAKQDQSDMWPNKEDSQNG